MGRSVSTPSNAHTVAYTDLGDWDCAASCDGCGECFNQKLEDFTTQLDELFPSLSECDKWLGWGNSEDHAVRHNSFAYFGISEYCGLISLWIVSKSEELRDSWYPEDISKANLADRWCDQVAEKFRKTFGDLRLIARASNGEAFFERS